MDATRSFEPLDGSGPLEDESSKKARAYEQAQLDRAAGGLGYGTRHANYPQYLSKLQPPRATESFFNERPCVFPTVELPPQPTRPNNLEQLSFEEQELYQRPLKSKVASGLGFGSKRNHQAYLANTYWRKE